MDLIPINLLIGDRSYRIKIQPKDEAVVRHTAKVINDKLVEYRASFAAKDMQDYVAMVLIWFATHQTGAMNSELEEQALQQQLDSIEKMVDGALTPQSPQEGT